MTTAQANSKYMVVRSSETADISKLTSMQIMLEKGSTATTYQPYVSQEQDVDLSSKNLFDISNVVSSTNVINNDNGTLTITSTSTSTSVVANDPKKLIDYCPELKVDDVVYLNANTTATQEGNDRIYLLGSNTSWYFGTTKTITQADLDSNVYWYATGLSTTATISDIIISKENIPYEPYYSYGDYCKIGTYADRIFKNVVGDPDYSDELEMGDWYIKKNIGKVVLDCKCRYN